MSLRNPDLSEPRLQDIFSARADELRDAPDQKKLTFQMEGLADWGDVAYRVLRAVGWQASCTYPVAILLRIDEQTRTRWNEVIAEPDNQERECKGAGGKRPRFKESYLKSNA